MERKISLYRTLNDLAPVGGCVIFGGTSDLTIPLGELKETFSLQGNFYNRSLPGLQLEHAAELYDLCVADLAPEEVFLHLGEADPDLFACDAALFDRQYAALLRHIRQEDPACSLTIVSLKNPDSDPLIEQLNRHLEILAQNECCRFCDIAKRQVFSPRQTKAVMSFLCSTGFVRPLKRQKQPAQDLARILFCCEAALQA